MTRFLFFRTAQNSQLLGPNRVSLTMGHLPFRVNIPTSKIFKLDIFKIWGCNFFGKIERGVRDSDAKM